MKKNYRDDFTLLKNSEIIYFDNAATTQKPDSVIQAVNTYYNENNSNPFRGIYDLSVKATEDYENARTCVSKFINANEPREVIFTKGTTESINLVAFSYGLTNINEGDEIFISIAEHHSNILPWQMVCRQKKANLVYMYCDNDGIISTEEINAKITNKTKLVAVGHISNILGQFNPVEEIIKAAHSVGAVVLLDGAQSVPHVPVDVRALDVDFLVFSGHKMLAPMGIGVLYAKRDILEAMPPFLSGGDMIDSVTEQSAVFTELPNKFEAGTVNCAGAVGLEAAIKYIKNVGFDYIKEVEDTLTKQLVEGMLKIPGVNIIGSKDYRLHHGIVSFNIDDVHPHDVASIFNEANIAVRAGHHCAQPLLTHLSLSSSARVSVYFYNTTEEVDKFLEVLKGIRGWMGFES